MEKIKNNQIEEPLKKGEPQEEHIPFEATEKQTEVINRIYMRFQAMRNERDKSREEFDGRTLREYVVDNINQWNGITPEDIKISKEDWQSLIFDHITRGKVKTIVAMVTGSAPYINIIGETEEDNEFAEDMRRVYEYEWRKSNEYYNNYVQSLSACIKGTVIVEEFYEEIKVKEKEIINVNSETGKVTYRTKSKIKGGAGSVKSRIVPLLNFYPNENSCDIRHDCIVMSYPTIDVFQKKYGKYPNAECVTSGFAIWDLPDIEYRKIGDDTKNIVEVLKYYNEDDDEFVILANGVWINPQGDKDEDIAPLPYNHKELPFSKTVYELADEELFYGKALPDIMAGDQELLNAILRMIADREVLSLTKPILLGLGAELESYQLVPGGILTMDGDINQAREMDISDASQAPFSLLEYVTKKSNINTAIDPMSQGVATGGRKTARESILLDQNSKQMASSFQMFVYKLLLRRARLRIANIKQFYKKPIQYVALKDKYGKPILDSEGAEIMKPGYRTIIEESKGSKPKWVELKPEVCNANYHIRLEEDFYQSKGQQDKIEKADMLLAEAKANPLLDADECTLNWLMAYGHDPKRFYKGLGDEQEVKDMYEKLGGSLTDTDLAVNNEPINPSNMESIPGRKPGQ